MRATTPKKTENYKKRSQEHISQSARMMRKEREEREKEEDMCRPDACGAAILVPESSIYSLSIPQILWAQAERISTPGA